jgi:hypothetical protein
MDDKDQGGKEEGKRRRRMSDKLHPRRVGILPGKRCDTSRPASVYGREVRSPYYLHPGIECSSSCHFRLKISPPRPMPLALQEGAQVTMSHLEFAIDAGEDFERDRRVTGATAQQGQPPKNQ